MIVKKSHLWKSKAMQKVTMETFVMWNGSWQRANEVLSGTQQQSWNILGWPNSLSGFFITSYEKTQTFGPPNANPIMSRQYAESWTHNSNELNIFVNLKTFLKVKSESHSVVSNSLWCHGLYSPWDSPGQNTGVGSSSLLRGIFSNQESNPGFPHCRWILYQLSYKGSPRILEWVAYSFSKRSSQPRNQIRVSWIAGRFFTLWSEV